jgi:predicted enzyme related to lactoylglutathione lyase
MNQPVTYVEIHSPDLETTNTFMKTVFGWATEPFARHDYLVAAAGEERGVDTGITGAADGKPLTVAVIRVPSLADAMQQTRSAGGTVVVEPFSITGVGRACYITDPAGVLLGLHEYDPEAE